LCWLSRQPIRPRAGEERLLPGVDGQPRVSLRFLDEPVPDRFLPKDDPAPQG